MPIPLLVGAALSLATEFGPSLIRRFAGDDAGDIAAKVVDVAQVVTGTATPDDALAAVRADPALAAQLRQRLAELDVELERAYLADRQDARARDVAIRSAGDHNMRGDVLSIGAFVALVGLVAALLFVPVPEGTARDILLLLTGTMAALVKEVFGFEFGSSRGSKEKDERLAPPPPRT